MKNFIAQIVAGQVPDNSLLWQGFCWIVALLAMVIGALLGAGNYTPLCGVVVIILMFATIAFFARRARIQRDLAAETTIVRGAP